MAKRIFVVGFDLPGDEFEYVEFNSDQSLLDADIVLYEPSLGGYQGFEEYNGRPLLTRDGSVRIVENIRHWKSELAAATNAGKLVIVYLAKPHYCYRYTGQQQFSGTGRSRVTTNLVTDVSSYEAAPNVSSVEAKTGQQMKLAPTAYAKGVLFGNNERLTIPAERGQAFTEKCMTAAKRLGVALVRTSDLFEPARYLLDNPDDGYAGACRQAIFEASGEIVTFPPPPISSKSQVAETTAGG